MRVFFILIIIFNAVFVSGQIYEGRIINAETGMAVPFANIRYHQNKGVISDIDGRYTVKASDVDSLKVSYVGFRSKTVEAVAGRRQIIELTPKMIDLAEVVIKPGINPAMRIVKNLIENKAINNPDNYNSYSYRAYDKLVFTVHEDSLARHREKIAADTSFMKLKKFFDKQHLFLMENITKTNYHKPGKKQEEVLASRTSGFNVPVFTLLLSQMQSASFYNKRIEIAGEVFYNPFTRGALSRYWYTMEDTLLSGQSDTSFVISFHPRRKVNFEGLKGVATISSDGWAFENIVAEPDASGGGLHVRIEQNYSRVEKKYWFPSQQNTELFLSNVQAGGVPLLGRGRRYLFDVKVNDSEAAAFNPAIAMKYAEDAFSNQNNAFQNYRRVPFTEKDRETYRVIDSIGRVENFSGKIKTLQSALNWDIRLGKFRAPLGRFLDRNKHEGWRLGAGLSTNKDFSKLFSLSGYGAYGTRDDQWKYGGEVAVYFDKLWRNSLLYKYSSDLAETAQYNNRRVLSITDTETYRNFGITSLNNMRRHLVELTVKPASSLQLRPFLQQEKMIPLHDYSYVQGSDSLKTFNFLEAGVALRFAFREKFMLLPDKEISLGTTFPVLRVRYQKGIAHKNSGAYTYNRLYLQINHHFRTNLAGETAYRIEGATVTDHVPLMKMFHGKGSSGSFLYSARSFTTMKYGEFYYHRFLSLFLEHDFEKLLLKTKHFSPAVSVHYHVQVGKLRGAENHQGMDYRDTRKGYHESGVVLDDILSFGIAGVGVSAFYRYGPYSLDSPRENLSLMMSLKFFSN
jgi:hypothetical protein